MKKEMLISTDARGNLALGRSWAHKLFRRIEDDEGRITLEPQVAVPTTQAYFWSERWQAAEGRVEEELKEGRVYEGTASELNAKLTKRRKRH